ncbi:BZ3500_MvSof-1268-A1-R1_Chr12-3g04016 [Microbotryum saponariae]|uniref:ATP-dependent RNA helicase n=1 Tax=Microbotryum saponariae TaxID=289078 RepID=A0A2X0L738_9BASI|nr:BZ3500_MvSof-1268-A1-R1_Chr12-3g04016 [Microbotryum saponariae]SDA02544.1 BZ3501_MvSof-1269-A2-R1_Chr12-3g03671 [Microbotryum saponariae]
MFNIKRFDPNSTTVPNGIRTVLPSEERVLDDVALKIQQRKNKRKAFLVEEDPPLDPVASTSSLRSAPSLSTKGDQGLGSKGMDEVGEGGWKPAPGESPAEREKRLKREKRAAKFGFDPYARTRPSETNEDSTSIYQAPSTTPLLPIGTTGITGEWKPAPGESPAEREKRIKREKRAAKLGLPNPSLGESNSNHLGQSINSRFVPPPSSSAFPKSYHTEEGAPQTEGAGLSTIHPDRLAAPALARELKAKKPQATTPARLRYLKKKKLRAKGRKRGMASGAGKKDGVGSTVGGTSIGGTSVAGTEVGSDEEEGEEDVKEDGKTMERKMEKDEEKLRIIAEKKAERKAKRDAKKAEIRKLKAEGGVVPPTKPRVIAAKPSSPVASAVKTGSVTLKVVPEVPEVVEDKPAEPTEEELEKRKEKEARLARKEAKRQKRATRHTVEEPTQDEDIELEGPPTLIPTAHKVEQDVPIAVSDKPIPMEADPVPQRAVEEEPSPLLRLPSATRPAPPSKKTLSELNVHESVRNKRIVDPERKVRFDDETLGLAERGRKRLAEMGLTEAFAVQTEVLPLLLPPGEPNSLYSPFRPPRDVCVSAPTGSGKTLSYVIPIVEVSLSPSHTLAPRIVTCLRALIVLPTRDLVGQVRETFEAFSKGLGLKIGTATGQHSFTHEQTSLVGENASTSFLQGGSSLVDILIVTPGRLMDHLRSTPGFSLQHLRYLVVDEADRLLTQSFNEWLPAVLAALHPTPSTTRASIEPSSRSDRADIQAPAWWDAETGRTCSELDVRSVSSCQKLLFSATLSRDPAKIDSLQLHRPLYISVEDALDPHAEDEAIDQELKFTFPASLKEQMIISPSTHKPLYLLHLLHGIKVEAALCFTKSVEAANRLAKLVEFFEQARKSRGIGEGEGEEKSPVVKAYSSDLAPVERMKLLMAFKQGEIQIRPLPRLICSDLISRGIDLPHVNHVISYDIPADMRKYVHRVGRTARAGKAGNAWSLIEDPEVAPFKAIMKAAQHWERIKRVRVKDSDVERFVEDYQVALEKLKSYFATGQAARREV